MQQQDISHPDPHLRVRTTSPTESRSQSMLAQPAFMGGGWNDLSGGQYLSAIPRNFQDPRYHKRASSGSSINSGGPPSPLDQATLYQPRIAHSDATYSPSRFEYDASAKMSQSQADSSMMFQPLYNGSVDMRRIQSQGADDRTNYTGAPSVSTMSHQNSPATPQAWEDYSDDKAFNFNHTMAYTQTMQDLFLPSENMAVHSPTYSMNKMGNHRHNMMQERLHEAQQLRTSSPTSNPRDTSPFKPNSSYMRPAQAQAQSQQMPQLQKQRTSISPKELMLDGDDLEDNQQSLFPEHSPYNARRPRSNLSNTYTAPFLSQENSSLQMPQNFPFVSQPSSQNIPADSTPDFPAPMLSMESTNEDGLSEPSSQQSSHRLVVRSEPRSTSRPVDTSSDAGTYSCTYHGCPERFESPVKLQKHKRDAHRSHEPVSPSLTLRNTQAGPHRCDRINPQTGKPCNSIFSRPYDLTRHEDTIHNARKQKVRCHLCTGPDEKTFSRNDALTRHMRVVHPDVDWVGKQKRRSK